MKPLRDLRKRLSRIEAIAAQQFLIDLRRERRSADERSLSSHGFRVYSQSDEDGLIQEIFRRIGTTTRLFVEVGVGNGLENNTRYLVRQDWSGTWIEGSEAYCQQIRASFADRIAAKHLVLQHTLVTRENIAGLLETCNGYPNLDLFSLDIDGNDYHVLEAIPDLSSRVVILEYNAKFPPPFDWKMPYNPEHEFDRTDSYGASLTALEGLMRAKGYALVGSNLTGVNAFFVREDLCGSLFSSGGAAELYEPDRHWLIPHLRSGHSDSGQT